MADNDFLTFGTGAVANVLSQTDWAALADRSNGFQSGVARSAHVNKAIRQAAFVAAMIGQFTADYGGDALDNGDLPTFEDNFKAALAAWIASGESPIDLSSYVLRAGDTMTGLFTAPVGLKTTARILTSPTTLSPLDLGKFIELSPTSSIAIVFPSPSDSVGGSIVVWNNSSYVQTISAPSGAFLGPNVTSSATISILPGDIYIFVSDSFNWIRSAVTSEVTASFPVVNFYETSATWTRASGATRAWVLAHGAGGAGGGATSGGANSSGSGGGAGEFRFGLFDITALPTAPVVIGAGGVAVVAADGGNGGGSNLGGLIYAAGGYGGALNASTGTNISNGGTGGGGGWGFPGSGGGSSQAGTGGEGGPGAFGGGGRAGNSSQGNKNGGVGARGGGGGGGDGYTAGTASGGNGGDGWALVVQI